MKNEGNYTLYIYTLLLLVLLNYIRNKGAGKSWDR